MNWESVEVIATLCSIVSFIAGFVTSKITTNIKQNRCGNSNSSIKQVVKGDGNTQQIIK